MDTAGLKTFRFDRLIACAGRLRRRPQARSAQGVPGARGNLRSQRPSVAAVAPAPAPLEPSVRRRINAASTNCEVLVGKSRLEIPIPLEPGRRRVDLRDLPEVGGRRVRASDCVVRCTNRPRDLRGLRLSRLRPPAGVAVRSGRLVLIGGQHAAGADASEQLFDDRHFTAPRRRLATVECDDPAVLETVGVHRRDLFVGFSERRWP